MRFKTRKSSRDLTQSNSFRKPFLGGKKSSRKKRKKLFNELISNIEMTRLAMARMYQINSGKGEQDVDEECGYPDHISFEMYKRMFLREGIAKRVVATYPRETWSVLPWVYETEKIESRKQTKFEKEWKRVQKKHNIYGKLHRLDEVSGIGHYGIILIGINDGRRLDRPIDAITTHGIEKNVKKPKPREITYLMVFDEGEAPIESFEKDENSPRYGKPLYYNLIISDPANQDYQGGKSQKVHWSRVIHVADNCMSSDIWGRPRQEPVYNYLLNIRKTLGGSAEMFWKGGFPGLSFEGKFPDVELDTKSIERQIQPYMKKLKRYLALENMEAKTLQPNIEEPRTHIDAQIMAICISIEIPMRVFMGTEEARLASIMDAESWNKRVHGRQNIHVIPNILNPFIERLMLMRVLPQIENFIIEWPDLYSISVKDQADITGVLVRAMSEYVSKGASRLFPPLQFLTMIMNMSPEQAEEIIKAAEKEVRKQKKGLSIAIPVEMQMAEMGMGGLKGNTRKSSTTKPSRDGQGAKQPRAKSGREATRPRRSSR